MSVTVTQELTQQTVTVTGNPVENNVTVMVSNARGPAGADGSAVINAATTSDGTADLLLANLETATAEVTGTLIAPHIHGNLAGSVYAHVRAGEALTKGDPVYVSGSHGSGATLIAEVSKADASNAAKMPAVGIMDAAVDLHANGHMVIVGTITELNTAGYSINAELYVAAGGGLTATPPAARAQPVARVERANANNGAILVKVNGLSASDATPSTLVRRTSGGGASFAGINTNSGSYSQVGGANFNVATTTAANLTATGSGTVTVSGAGGTTVSGGTLTFSPSGFAYGAGAAAAHRTALGLGTGDSPTFANATFNTGSIATSQPLSLTQTWATTATYTGLQMNITDSGPSNAASSLMDLRVGGVSVASVNKSGRGVFNNGVTFGNPSTTASGGIFGTNAPANYSLETYSLFLFQQGAVFPHGGSLSTAARLIGDAANTLAQRNGIGQPQAFRLYNTYSSSTNFERLNFRWSGNTAFIGTEKGSGGGTARDLVLETDGTERVRVTAAGEITCNKTITNSFNGNAFACNPFGPIGSAFSVYGLRFRSSSNIQWGSSSSTAPGAHDTQISRVGAGIVGVGTGAGAEDGTISLRNLTASGDIEATDSTKGVILKSPNGTRWRVTVDNTGALTPTLLA